MFLLIYFYHCSNEKSPAEGLLDMKLQRVNAFRLKASAPSRQICTGLRLTFLQYNLNNPAEHAQLDTIRPRCPVQGLADAWASPSPGPRMARPRRQSWGAWEGSCPPTDKWQARRWADEGPGPLQSPTISTGMTRPSLCQGSSVEASGAAHPRWPWFPPFPDVGHWTLKAPAGAAS